jgi:hypothetical protein
MKVMTNLVVRYRARSPLLEIRARADFLDVTALGHQLREAKNPKSRPAGTAIDIAMKA